MLVLGAKGFAKELLEEIHMKGWAKNLAFYDDINTTTNEHLFDLYPILHSKEEAKAYFKEVDQKFVLGLGDALKRDKLFEAFLDIGGQSTTLISDNATIGSFDVFIGEGCTIMSGAHISNCVHIGKGSLIYFNSVITHDCILGKFVEISPGATILGRTNIGDYTQIGANATILPDLKIGSNVIVGAGSVVLTNVPPNVTVVGNPARIIKHHD